MIRSTPTGDRAKAAIRKIDRWILKQEDECAIDWAYQELVNQLEELLEQTAGIDRERKERDLEEARERRANMKGSLR